VEVFKSVATAGMQIDSCMRIPTAEIPAIKLLLIVSSHNLKGSPAPLRRGGAAQTDRARQNKFGCRNWGLDRDGRSAHARRRRGDRARRMQRQLTNRTKSRVGAERGACNPVARTRALMKMCRAYGLRDEYQHRAENRDRARRRTGEFVKS